MQILSLLQLTTAALTIGALQQQQPEVAMGLAAATALLSLFSLVLGQRAGQERRRFESTRTELNARVAKLEADNQLLKNQLLAHDDAQGQLQKQLSQAAQSQLSQQSELDQLRSQQQKDEAELQALRMRKANLENPDQREASNTAVLQFLRSLQERGRFLDFAMADIQRLADAQVGAAARVVHQGIKVVLQDYFDIQPISSESEGSLVSVPNETADGHRFRLLSRNDGAEAGVGQKGKLLHRGWEARSIRLPQSMPRAAAAARIIAPAEIDFQGVSL